MHPSCQTLGVTKNMTVNLMHRAYSFKPSRPAIQCLSSSAVPRARATPTLRSIPRRRPFVAVAQVVGDSLKQATRASRLCALALPRVRAMPTLRSIPRQRPFVAVAHVVGCSSKRAIRASRNHRAKALQAQLVPALARRQRQMLVSLWALPLSECRCGLQGTVPRGSWVGSVQAAPRFSTVGDAQPFVQADGCAAA